MEHRVVILKRHDAPDWAFNWDDEFSGLTHRTDKNVYMLFYEDIATECKPIWIGRLSDDRKAWLTWEKELKAKSITLLGCSIVFN